MLLDVVHVAVQSEFTLVIEFENGEQRVFNMLPFMEQKPWVKLKCDNAFHGASVDNGTVVWPGNIDIDPERFMSFRCRFHVPVRWWIHRKQSTRTVPLNWVDLGFSGHVLTVGSL